MKPRSQWHPTALSHLMARVVIADTECWVWQGARNHHGYGRVTSRHWTGHLAHRFAWWLFHGDVPAGMTIDHLCRNRACVNPAHLEPVTMRENLHRSPLVIPSHCKRGHEFTTENTITRKRGSRECRTCTLARQRAAWVPRSQRRKVA